MSFINEKIAGIRKLLDELETEARLENEEGFQQRFSPLDIPDIIKDIVDYLMPILSPYEVAFYWYVFRHAIIGTGTQHVRISTRGMQHGVVNSIHSRDTNSKISLSQVRNVLGSMEAKGVIRKDGEANRDGTLYRVMIPEEIEDCRISMLEHQKIESKPVYAEKEVDFYNIRENRLQIYERDQYKCQYCGKQLTRFSATLDHIIPVTEGGENTYDNLTTACLSCNSQKNRRPVGDFLADVNSTPEETKKR